MDIKIYSTPWCHFCQMAKEFLTSHNVPFTNYDVSTDVEKRNEMIEITGQMGVPVIVIGDEIMIGYDKSKLAEKVGVTV